MEWLLESIVSAAVAGLVGGAMGSVSTIGIQRYIRYFARKGLPDKVEAAYQLLQGACFPETLNPEKPGNPDANKALARNASNLLIIPLRRAGFDPPPKCGVDDESLKSWFNFLEYVRIQLG